MYVLSVTCTDVSFTLLDDVHVIHQLTQAGRTLIGFLLNCQSDLLRPLIAPALDGLRSFVGLLRRFSDRYVCGQRSCDTMEEFWRPPGPHAGYSALGRADPDNLLLPNNYFL